MNLCCLHEYLHHAPHTHFVLLLLISIIKDLFSQFCSSWKIFTLSYIYGFPVNHSISDLEVELFNKLCAFEVSIFLVTYLFFYSLC